MSDAQDQAAVALRGMDQWATCDHALAERDHHRCPRCGGTLRRCCDSLVGLYVHREACPAVARSAAAVAGE